MVINKIKFQVVFLLFFKLAFAQQGNVTLKTIHKGNYNKIEIFNTTADTIQFSIYEQRKFKSEWITSAYDIYCNPENPNTTILAVYPKDRLEISAEIKPLFIFSDNNFKTKSAKHSLIRYVLIPHKKEYRDKTVYSNEVKIN